MQSKTENHTMRVFYLLAIVFVVDGHTTLGNLFDLNGLFRYYSFHLMMFAFGSGYFFQILRRRAFRFCAPGEKAARAAVFVERCLRRGRGAAAQVRRF